MTFNIMLIWLENAYSCHPFWGGRWGTFPPNDVTHRPNPKRTVLGLNHVIWAIMREYRSRGSSWALERKKAWQEKVTKGLYFTYLGKNCNWSDVHENLFSRCCSRHNHVCQVSKWNFQGLRFYRGSNFAFSHWFLNGPYNSDLTCDRCNVSPSGRKPQNRSIIE